MIIIPPETINEADIQVLRENGICVVTAKNPVAVKFVDPLPVQSSRTQIEDAAIKLSKRILTGQIGNTTWPLRYSDITALFTEVLIQGTPLQPGPTIEEREANYFTEEKLKEIRRLAQEEARAERAATKATKGKT